jgi:predicted PurR-regulated permease PerM
MHLLFSLSRGILGAFAVASGSNRTLCLVLMASIIVLVVIIVPFFGYFRPEVFSETSAAKQTDQNSIKNLRDDILRLQSEKTKWTDKCRQLEIENQQLTTRLNSVINLKSRIYASVAGFRSASLDMVLLDLNLFGNAEARGQVQSLITALMIDDDRIEPDVGGLTGHYRIRQPKV